MLLYLRHGDDRGDDVYRHDRRLNDRGRKKARKEAARLIERYGHPDHVFVSPYRRATDTLDAMRPSFARDVEVRHDPRVAQRLSEKQRRDPQVSPETRSRVAIDEDRETFRRRVADHVDELRRMTGLVWCITHQAVIEEVARHFGAKSRAPSTSSITW